jgi:hypothetical protein
VSLTLSQWFTATVSTIETWAKAAIAKVTTFLSPFLKDIEPYLEKDVIAIAQNGLPIVLAALGTNPVENLGAALIAGERYLVPALEAEGIKLFPTSINILTNMLAARAQISLTNTPSVAQVINTGVTAAVITPIPSDTVINTAGQ